MQKPPRHSTHDVFADPAVADPLIPDPDEFQHMALGYVDRRIGLVNFLLYGSGIFLASGTSLLVRWATGIEARGAALMTALGLLVMAVYVVGATVRATRPVRPSVAFERADQSIRMDRITVTVMAVIWVLLCVGSWWLKGGREPARVASILAGATVMFAVGAGGMLYARKLRMDRDGTYARWLTRRGMPVPAPVPAPRVVISGPVPIPGDPSDFELRALAHFGRTGRTAACFLMALVAPAMFIPLWAVNRVVGGDYGIWFVPSLIGLGLMLLLWVIGFLRSRPTKAPRPFNARWYAYSTIRARNNRHSGMVLVIGCLLLFVVLAVAVPPGREVQAWPLLVSVPVLGLSMAPFFFKVGDLYDRRRELYLAWMIRNGLVSAEFAKAHPPR